MLPYSAMMLSYVSRPTRIPAATMTPMMKEEKTFDSAIDLKNAVMVEYGLRGI